jgi:hypothetical protein
LAVSVVGLHVHMLPCGAIRAAAAIPHGDIPEMTSRSQYLLCEKPTKAEKAWTTVAVLTITGSPNMKAKRREELAAWLRNQADALEIQGKNYSARFRARYLVR